MNIRKPEDRVVEIPEQWSEPREVVAQVAHQLRGWLLLTKAIEHDLDVLRRELRTGVFCNREDLELQVAHAHLRLQELNHEVAGQLLGYILLADHLRRTQQLEDGGQ